VTTFDRLFAEAAPLIERGLHQRDSPPVEGGRWPVSLVLRPDDTSAARLERAMVGAQAFAGPGHFRTGATGSLHITVRALEGYRDAARAEDAVVQRYATAMRRAVRQVGVVRLDLVGLTLTTGTVMVAALPTDENAEGLMDVLEDELGEDGWFEAGFRRDIWYANVLHFAADIEAPAELVAWVRARRDLDLGRMVMDTAELVRFRYEDATDGRLMRPEVLASVRFGLSTRSSALVNMGVIVPVMMEGGDDPGVGFHDASRADPRWDRSDRPCHRTAPADGRLAGRPDGTRSLPPA